MRNTHLFLMRPKSLDDVVVALREISEGQKRLEARLKHLAGFVAALQQPAESELEQEQPNSGAEQKQVRLIRTETTFPRALINKYYADQNQANRVHIWIFLVTVASFLVLVAYTLYTYKLWATAIQQWEGSVAALDQNRLALRYQSKSLDTNTVSVRGIHLVRVPRIH